MPTPIAATISLTMYGPYSHLICWAKKVNGDVWIAITACLSMLFFWILRTVAPWLDLPSDYRDWKNTHSRFCRWNDKDIWARFQERLIKEPDYEWLMIDASHIKVYPHASGAQGGNQDVGLPRGAKQ